MALFGFVFSQPKALVIAVIFLFQRACIKFNLSEIGFVLHFLPSLNRVFPARQAWRLNMECSRYVLTFLFFTFDLPWLSPILASVLCILYSIFNYVLYYTNDPPVCKQNPHYASKLFFTNPPLHSARGTSGVYRVVRIEL